MLHLNPNTQRFINAKRTFGKEMRDFVFSRIDSIKKIKSHDTHIIDRFFSNILNDHIDDILIGEPRLLININERINQFINLSPDFRKGIEYVFNYGLFITKTTNRYDAYRLAETLDVKSCTYCNRNYTNTVIKKGGNKLTRPQFDHFFDKANYPLLALSFYNLIPSCAICNSSIKGTKKMNLNDYLHPYLDNEIDNIRFTYKYNNDTISGLNVKVITLNSRKAKNTTDLFAIEEIYNSHASELHDMIKTRQYFSDRYLEILKNNLLSRVILSREDLYRLAFGTEYYTANFINKPLSKFKSDILKELGII